MGIETIKGAVLSDDRRYRYALARSWDLEKQAVAFIGLNPSTADETQDDATISKCIRYAQRWGYGTLLMLNLFAFRSTDPTNLRKAEDPVGPENDEWLFSMMVQSLPMPAFVGHTPKIGAIVAAWGTHGKLMNRGWYVQSRLPLLKCLRVTKHGYPEHPLYLKGDLELIEYERQHPVHVTKEKG